MFENNIINKKVHNKYTLFRHEIEYSLKPNMFILVYESLHFVYFHDSLELEIKMNIFLIIK